MVMNAYVWETRVLLLTLFKKPFSTLAALTDNDLGILIGFSKMTETEEHNEEKRE